MPQSTHRLLLFLVLTALMGSLVVFVARHHQGKAEDLLSFMPVGVCSTKRDTEPGQHTCPDTAQTVANCHEAIAAIAGSSEVTLASRVTPSPHLPDCELQTVDSSKHLYKFALHGYLTPGATVRNVLDALYVKYSNLDQSSNVANLAVPKTNGLQPFSAAFLVQGEPGFRVAVSLHDENSVTHPGAKTLVKMSCGNASDTMVAEADGNSWFSFAGYERLDCRDQPLVASVIVERDSADRWALSSPTYNYAYSPERSVLEIQNRPQPALTFNGNWQGIGALVEVGVQALDGSTRHVPIQGAAVEFSCNSKYPTPTPSEHFASPLAKTNIRGMASMPLADAELLFQGCGKDQFTATLLHYAPGKGADDPSDPTYDHYFPNPGPLAAGLMNASALTGGRIPGNDIEIGGTVRLNDVGSTPGGAFGGSTVCLFLSGSTARDTLGCPNQSSAYVYVTQANDRGNYLFGADATTRISYGSYLRRNSTVPTLRIVTYKNATYPNDVIGGYDSKLALSSFNQRDIRLPTARRDLENHLCQAVRMIWKTGDECTPLFNIVTRESEWNVAATNSSSGACGLFQANPCEKHQETAAGSEAYVSISNQFRWGLRYVHDRYQSPSNAWVFWQAHNYY
jgi:hypothetical protein